MNQGRVVAHVPAVSNEHVMIFLDGMSRITDGAQLPHTEIELVWQGDQPQLAALCSHIGICVPSETFYGGYKGLARVFYAAIVMLKGINFWNCVGILIATESSPISKVPVQDLLLKNGSASVVVRSGSAIALLVLFMVTGWISVWERTSKLYYPPGAVLASPHDIIDPNSRQLRGVNDCSASNAALALVSATRGMLPANVN
ncbi:hypothetical protein U1Q18_044847 [Sarracenia purpurea var. burkii]